MVKEFFMYVVYAHLLIGDNELPAPLRLAFAAIWLTFWGLAIMTIVWAVRALV